MSPLARRASIKVALYHSLISFQWSSRPYGASGDFSFPRCFTGKCAKRFEKFMFSDCRQLQPVQVPWLVCNTSWLTVSGQVGLMARQEIFRCFFFGRVLWKFLQKKVKNFMFSRMSPPDRCTLNLVPLNYSLISFQWSSTRYGVSGDSSLFSLGDVLALNVAKSRKCLVFGF